MFRGDNPTLMLDDSDAPQLQHHPRMVIPNAIVGRFPSRWRWEMKPSRNVIRTQARRRNLMMIVMWMITLC